MCTHQHFLVFSFSGSTYSGLDFLVIISTPFCAHSQAHEKDVTRVSPFNAEKLDWLQHIYYQWGGLEQRLRVGCCRLTILLGLHECFSVWMGLNSCSQVLNSGEKTQFHCGIEWLWRGVWVAFTSKYRDVLHSMGEDGLLDIYDEVHPFGVHYIFVPRLRADLDTFIGGWNNHPLWTEGGLTPEQQWHYRTSTRSRWGGETWGTQ